MKIRMRSGSIRLRLTRGEVGAVHAEGEVTEHVELAHGARLSWSLRASDTADAITATLDGAALAITVPTAIVRAWASSDQVGFEGAQDAPGAKVRILVEKDWACLAPREDEDDADAYPHPRKKPA